MPDVRFTLFDTTIGRCGVVWANSGIVAVQLPYPDEAQTRVRIRQRHADLVEALPPARVQTAIEGMVTLLQGRPIDLSSVDLDLGEQPAFNREVYAITRGIPPGATLT